jgi:hypothetical protein
VLQPAPTPADLCPLPIPILDFLTDDQLEMILRRAEPEITELIRSAANQSSCRKWPEIYRTLCDLVGPTRSAPCHEPAVFALRSFDLIHDRVFDLVHMCGAASCLRCNPLQARGRPYGALKDHEPSPGAWMPRGRVNGGRTLKQRVTAF